MSKKTAAYLAGLIDGEGCLEIQKRKKKECIGEIAYVPRVRICMTNKEIIEWLRNSFGGYIFERAANGNQRKSWTWALLYRKVKPFIDAIYPYLRVKKKQAEILKKFLKTYEKNRPDVY